MYIVFSHQINLCNSIWTGQFWNKWRISNIECERFNTGYFHSISATVEKMRIMQTRSDSHKFCVKQVKMKKTQSSNVSDRYNWINDQSQLLSKNCVIRYNHPLLKLSFLCNICLEFHIFDSICMKSCSPSVTHWRIQKKSVTNFESSLQFKCDYCHKTFGRKTRLRTHFNKVHLFGALKTYDCEICCTKYRYKSNLTAHISRKRKWIIYTTVTWSMIFNTNSFQFFPFRWI